jgi:hypothetical protein
MGPPRIELKLLHALARVAMIALPMFVLLAGCRQPAEHSSKHDEPGRSRATSAPAPGGTGDAGGRNAAGPVFTDAAKDAGLNFVHVCGDDGSFWLPEEMGAGGGFLDY